MPKVFSGVSNFEVKDLIKLHDCIVESNSAPYSIHTSTKPLRPQHQKRRRALAKLLILRLSGHQTGCKYDTSNITTKNEFEQVCFFMGMDELKLVKHDIRDSNHQFDFNMLSGKIEDLIEKTKLQCELCFTESVESSKTVTVCKDRQKEDFICTSHSCETN